MRKQGFESRRGYKFCGCQTKTIRLAFFLPNVWLFLSLQRTNSCAVANKKVYLIKNYKQSIRNEGKMLVRELITLINIFGQKVNAEMFGFIFGGKNERPLTQRFKLRNLGKEQLKSLPLSFSEFICKQFYNLNLYQYDI